MLGRLIPFLTSAAMALAACGGGNSSPTPVAPSAPTVTGVAITGTATLTSRGQTSQLTATATMSNGTTQAVTGQATWQSSNTAVATVSAAGVVTAVGDGEATVTATYQAQSGQMKVGETLPTRAIADVSLVLKAYTPGGQGMKYRWENIYTFKETGGVYGYTVTSFRIDYYDQHGTFVIAQTWDAVNIALALGAGGRIAPGASQAWPVNWNTNAAVTRVRADYQGTARDDAGSAIAIQGSQSVDMPATAAVRQAAIAESLSRPSGTAGAVTEQEQRESRFRDGRVRMNPYPAPMRLAPPILPGPFWPPASASEPAGRPASEVDGVYHLTPAITASARVFQRSAVGTACSQ